MVAWEIDVGRNPTSPAPVHVRIVPIHKNHINTGAIPIPKNHVDTRTIHTPKNQVDAGTVPILESRINIGTVHVHADMPIGVRIPQRSNGPTMPL